jgi:hypothetical protein
MSQNIETTLILKIQNLVYYEFNFRIIHMSNMILMLKY